MTDDHFTARMLQLLNSLPDQVSRAVAEALKHQHKPRRGPSDEDKARIAELLPAVHAAVQDRPFTVAQLTSDPSPFLRNVLRQQGLSPKSIGKLLTRFEGVFIDGLMLKRHGENGDAVVRRIVAGFVAPRKPGKPER